MNQQNLLPSSICTQLGDDPERFHGAVVPPIYENSLFVYPTFEQFLSAASNEQANYLYTRGQNPTVEIVERKIAALENGESCKLFASGMAAISASLLAFLNGGDHVLCVGNTYGPTLKLLTYLKKFNIDHSMVIHSTIENIESELRANTKVIYIESPSTMTFQLADLREIGRLAKAHHIRTIIDNTWATPLYQKPLEMGIDISVHSASKYLGGHSDLIGGAMITSIELMEQIFYREYQLFGGIMPPFEAWLLMRGLRTLPLRLKAHQESAHKITAYLESNPKVQKVNYPLLSSHPQFELGQKQLSGYSGLFSFQLKDTRFESIVSFINHLKIFKIGVSWGGHESLVLSPHNGRNAEELEHLGIAPGLIRLAIGLEEAETLLEDLELALSSIHS